MNLRLTVLKPLEQVLACAQKNPDYHVKILAHGYDVVTDQPSTLIEVPEALLPLLLTCFGSLGNGLNPQKSTYLNPLSSTSASID